MRVECTYIAIDETEFDTEAECLAYEQGLKDRLKAAVFYDDERKVVDAEKDGTGDAYYIRIVDAKEAPFLFEWLSHYVGFDYPADDDYKDGDLFVYDCDHDEWVNLTAQKKFIEGVEALFKKEGESDATGASPSAD